MEIEVLENKKDTLEFILKGERHTFPNLLKSALLKDSAVEMAAYSLDHPMDNFAKFIVKTKGKTAAKAVQDAVKLIDSELSDFEDAFKKALK